MNSPKSQNELHISHWEHFCSSEQHSKLYPTWWDSGTANHWRHERFLEAPLSIFTDSRFKESSWLTIGDGSGHDTWILGNYGYTNILTSDIGTTILERSFKEGHIKKFVAADAERLPFKDGSFDFVLCKEALHHMQRPYSAIYNMLRVAKYAVIIIEPQDRFIDVPCLPPPITPFYESVGNFVYSFSKAELIKVAFGLNLPCVVTKNMVDIYIEGCEFERATSDNIFFQDMVNQVQDSERNAIAGSIKWNYIKAVLFNGFSDYFSLESIKNDFTQKGWDFLKTDTNPYL